MWLTSEERVGRTSSFFNLILSYLPFTQCFPLHRWKWSTCLCRNEISLYYMHFISFCTTSVVWKHLSRSQLPTTWLVSGFPPCLHYPPPTAPTLLPWGEASSPTTMQPILVTEEARITSTPSRVALLSVYFRWKWRYFASSTPEELWHEGVPITQRKPPLFVFLLQERGWLPALSTWKISFCLLQRVRGPQELPLSLVSPQEGLNNPEEGGHRYSLMHTSAAHFV